jgi:hypothetical protein
MSAPTLFIILCFFLNLVDYAVTGSMGSRLVCFILAIIAAIFQYVYIRDYAKLLKKS